MLPDRVAVLAQIAERAEDIDVARAEAAKRRAEERLARPAADVDLEPARMARCCRRHGAAAGRDQTRHARLTPTTLTFSSAVSSHPGVRREANEDTFCARPDLGLYAVADGIGGHAAGEVASRPRASKVIETFINDMRAADIDRDVAVSATTPTPQPRRQPACSSRSAWRIGDSRSPMGATKPAARHGHDGRGESGDAAHSAIVAHVGDSRVYLMARRHAGAGHAGSFMGGEQVRAGLMTEADARAPSVAQRRHPGASAAATTLAVDLAGVELGRRPPADLLGRRCPTASCLHGTAWRASSAGRPRARSDLPAMLVDAANQRGRPDNITVR